MSAQFEVQHIAHSHINHTQETLVLSLELALVENLDGYNGRVLDSTNYEVGSY